jgi:hypothetical protein
MAFNRGPKIVTNGLVLALDAASRNSYPGSGTTWTDLSGNNLTGSLINTPTYSSENGGSLSFNGTNQYINVGSNTSLRFTGTSAYTLSIWIYPTQIKDQGLITRYNAGQLGNYYMNMTASGSLMVFREVAPYNSPSSSFRCTANNYYNCCMIYDGSTMKMAINGTIDPASASAGDISANQNNINLLIGASQSNNAPYLNFAGSIYSAQIYNRALTATEILQNYNATKSRFNL